MPAAHVHYIGAETGIEARVLPAEGVPHTLLPASRLRGGGPRVLARGLVRLPTGVLRAMRLLRRLRARVVVGVGGYASGAAVLAAVLLRIPVVVQEQNAVPGLTNRLAARVARMVFVSFEGAMPHVPPARVRVTGNPIRRAIRERLGRARPLRSVDRPLSLLVFGGSQGARFLNEQVPAVVGRLAAAGVALRVVHQTGKAELDATRERYRALGVEADVRPYIDDMAAAYAAADFAICRAGASTIAELTAVGLPALLVPFPFAAHDHQAANAHAVASAGGALCVRQEEWDTAAVASQLGALATDPARLASVASSAQRLGRPEAADRIAEAVLALAVEKG
jgi:UDP-N-acetylglucosamine--N-acetylmuramyl-(pentapeptide) pyrophosphoryl-undecaprenol N-acetylglucosamine transferase